MKKHWPFVIAAILLCGSCNNQPTNQHDENEESMTDNHQPNAVLLDEISKYISNIESEFNQISEERKTLLKQVATFVQNNLASGKPSNLIFICTHNSRRSHMSQFWAQVAAFHYHIPDVYCYSGGTETTALNPRTVKALRKAGFQIEQTDSSTNPIYLVYYAKGVDPIKGFSKKYDDPFNPRENFAAVMTCSQADEACPHVPGATVRIALPFDDPKIADNTHAEEAKYDERCRQIAVEMFYAFSLVKQ